MSRVMNKFYLISWFYMHQSAAQLLNVRDESLAFKLDRLFMSFDGHNRLYFMPTQYPTSAYEPSEDRLSLCPLFIGLVFPNALDDLVIAV